MIAGYKALSAVVMVISRRFAQQCDLNSGRAVNAAKTRV